MKTFLKLLCFLSGFTIAVSLSAAIYFNYIIRDDIIDQVVFELKIFKDPEFHALPLDEKQKTLNYYFDNYMVKGDKKFAALPKDEQIQTRDNFANSQIGFGDKRKADQARIDRIDAYIPDFAEKFVHEFGWMIVPLIIVGVFSRSKYCENIVTKIQTKVNNMDTNFSNKTIRLLIVISLFWIAGWFLTIYDFHYWHIKSDSAYVYRFIFFGLLPLAIFWAYYWVRNAKD